MDILNEKSLILIVEDNVTTLDLLVMHLSQHNFETVTARSGSMALRRAQHIHPDLILLDVMLPGGDGFEICRQLKSDPHTWDISVIFMTVLSDNNDILKGFEVGGADYVAKPFHLPEVTARLNAHLTSYRLQKALKAEVQRREASEEELRRLYVALQKAKNTLEQKVDELTGSLAEANMALNSGVGEREKERLERDKLLTLIKHQNQQLNELALSLMQLQNDPGQSQFLPPYILQQITRMLDEVMRNLGVMTQSLCENCHLMSQSAPLHSIETATEMLGQVNTYLTSVDNEVFIVSPDAGELLASLSRREKEVLRTIAQGCTTEEIATLLRISTNTVYTYRRRIMEKLNLNTTVDLLKVAVQVTSG